MVHVSALLHIPSPHLEVGVGVGVPVFVGVPVGVGVRVGVPVGVCVGVFVEVGVPVLLGVGETLLVLLAEMADVLFAPIHTLFPDPGAVEPVGHARHVELPG